MYFPNEYYLILVPFSYALWLKVLIGTDVITRPGVWFDSWPEKNISFFIASKQVQKSVYRSV